MIAVVDTGVGIPIDKLKKLMSVKESFSTLGTENESGTGLGLILSKGFVQLNNGTIQVESEEGKGTTFNFTLPLA
jgi:two-component system, sensor histidine kinase and response regulator